ncbi:uncharacterized protein [Lepeophtheirus salmonis]|uniref:uncharacterized protein isoform X1 n=1 Tax=Lepeophtheirus salmonis TaxID=72036 RepID=UPI001AE5F664|nr:protein abrupt-like isoform X1 [Lepeophtheirus salmonis]XP_040580532.1 protein abrupt-like isoform X1 [Lepeophtheirus salmonis]
MTSEQFCLKWNNYQSNIVSALGNLKLDEDFVDVTLSCEGRTIKAHKVILSACSLYFRDVFRETPCNHPIIILKDTQYSDLESLVKYVYQGQVYISQENLSSFLKTADALQIKGLAEQSQPAPSGSNESSPNSSPDHDQSPFPETINKNIQVPSFPAPPMSPVLSSSYPSQSSSATTLPRTSPIKIPTISHLKRSSFSNLAQYLSGSNAMSSPPLNGDSSPPSIGNALSKKRKVTPPTKRYELPNYSGSTSTASPGSPPHSHSTDGGGEHSLEMGEESDRDSARSIESTDLVKPPIISDYDVSTKEHHHHHHHPQPMTHSPFHNHTHYHHPRLPLMVNDKKEPDDFGETLDLSKNSSRHHHASTTYPTTNTTSNTTTTIPNISTHISGGVLEAALTASDPLTSGRNIGTVPTPKRSSMHSSAPTSSSSSTTTNTTTLPPNGGLPSQSKDKDGQGASPNSTNTSPTTPPPPPLANSNNNNNNNTTTNNNHPRNRWRCMQPRICNYCWKTFSNSFNLKQHIVNVHVQSQGVSCSLCEKVVKNKWYLRKHLVTAHGAPLKRVKGSEKSNTASSSSLPNSAPNNNNNNISESFSDSESNTSTNKKILNTNNNKIIDHHQPTSNESNSDNNSNKSHEVVM